MKSSPIKSIMSYNRFTGETSIAETASPDCLIPRLQANYSMVRLIKSAFVYEGIAGKQYCLIII